MAETFPPAATPGSFANRTIIVGGGAGTIGRAICKALADAGANVVINDVNEEAVNEMVSSFTSAGQSALGITLSATSGDEIIAQTIKEFGAVHAVINTILGRIPWGPFESRTNDDFRELFESAVLGPLSLARAAWPYFKTQNHGRVINFTSDSILGMPTGSTYTITKGALFGVNKTLAMEGRPHNIKVNCVSPIAYKPVMESHIQYFSEDAKAVFRSKYTVEGNVPMILALLSENCEVSGQVFNLSGYSVSRSVCGVTKRENGLQTVDECLAKIDSLCKKEESGVYEPEGMADFVEFQARYVSGK